MGRREDFDEYLIPVAWLLQTFQYPEASGNAITWTGFFSKSGAGEMGNIVGGSVLVGLVYHVIYRRTPGQHRNR